MIVAATTIGSRRNRIGVVPAWGAAAVDRELAPRDALHAGDGADGDAVVLQHRSLLDVEFYIGVREAGGRARGWSGVADAFQFVAEPGPIGGAGVQRLLDREPADVHERTEHVRREARPFLVGEEGDLHTAGRTHACRGEGLDDLEPGEHSEVAVEPATGGDGVDVRTDHHRGERGVGPFVGGDAVADGVDGDGEPEIAHP